MKTLAVLAVLVIAAPVPSFADHRCFSPPPSFCAPGYYGGFSHFNRPFGYFAPQPYVSLSFVSSRAFVNQRPVYRASRYYDVDDYSYEIDVQRALRRRGYYFGDVDGDIGPRSRAAIRDYQADHRLPITGRVDGPLLRSLGI